MMNEATKRIQARLDQENLKYDVQEKDGTSWVEIGINTDQFTLKIHFFSSDNDPDVSVRVIPLVKGNEAKRDVLLRVCNDLNRQFRYAKFAVDNDSDVCMEYDFPLKTPMSSVGDFAMECISRFLSISKKAYPELMKALWA